MSVFTLFTASSKTPLAFVLPALLGVGCAHGPRAEPLVVEADGTDQSAVQVRWPAAAWMPLQGPLRQNTLNVVALVNGLPVVATLDTGAMATTMSESVARRLGLSRLVNTSTQRSRITDAHGVEAEVVDISLTTLAVGPVTLDYPRVHVAPSDNEFFLIGFDVLKDWEIYIAADEGLVGLFAPGTGPRDDDDIVVPLQRAERQLTVYTRVRGAQGDAPTPMVVDTGASGSTYPSAVAVENGVAADLRLKGTTIGAVSTKDERGSFLLQPLRIGIDEFDVGTVVANESLDGDGRAPGLLGVDVYFRFRTLIVPQEPAVLRLHPLPERESVRRLGPDGYACSPDCVSVAILDVDDFRQRNRRYGQIAALASDGEERDGARDGSVTDDGAPRHEYMLRYTGGGADEDPKNCLAIDVHGAWGGHTVELAVTDASATPGGLMNGAALTVIAHVPKKIGVHACLPLPRSVASRGVSPATPLSIVFLRADNAVTETCDANTACVFWTGS